MPRRLVTRIHLLLARTLAVGFGLPAGRIVLLLAHPRFCIARPNGAIVVHAFGALGLVQVGLAARLAHGGVAPRHWAAHVVLCVTVGVAHDAFVTHVLVCDVALAARGADGWALARTVGRAVVCVEIDASGRGSQSWSPAPRCEGSDNYCHNHARH